jgi:hypothetical protein
VIDRRKSTERERFPGAGVLGRQGFAERERRTGQRDCDAGILLRAARVAVSVAAPGCQYAEPKRQNEGPSRFPLHGCDQ